MKNPLLKEFAKKALKLASEEAKISGNNYSEEALRYIVVGELSKLKKFGQFPNIENSNYHIYFEYNYQKFKTKRGIFRPDIASVINPNINQLFANHHPLAIELKITSEIKKDINKCREYLSLKKGGLSFEYAMIIVVPHRDKLNSLRRNVHDLKRRQALMKPILQKEKILFCWSDYENDLIETFWIR